MLHPSTFKTATGYNSKGSSPRKLLPFQPTPTCHKGLKGWSIWIGIFVHHGILDVPRQDGAATKKNLWLRCSFLWKSWWRDGLPVNLWRRRAKRKLTSSTGFSRSSVTLSSAAANRTNVWKQRRCSHFSKSITWKDISSRSNLISMKHACEVKGHGQGVLYIQYIQS